MDGVNKTNLTYTWCKRPQAVTEGSWSDFQFQGIYILQIVLLNMLWRQIWYCSNLNSQPIFSNCHVSWVNRHSTSHVGGWLYHLLILKPCSKYTVLSKFTRFISESARKAAGRLISPSWWFPTVIIPWAFVQRYAVYKVLSHQKSPWLSQPIRCTQ